MDSHIQHFGGMDGPNFADILNFFPDPCFAIDLQGKVIAWNQEMEALTGIRAQDMLGKDNYEYAIPFYGYRRPLSVDLLLKWDEKIAKQYNSVRKDGETLISEVENPPFKPEPSLFWNKARKIYNAHGECIGAMEVIRDMTEYKKSEQELKRTEAEKALILDTTSEMIAYLDLDMRFKWINKANATALGRPMDDVIGCHCYELWHNRTFPCEGCPVIQAKLNRMPHQAEIITPDGRCWLARGYPVFDEWQNVTGMIEFTLEITDRKRMEEQLRETTDSLAEAQRIAKIGNWAWDIVSGQVKWSDEVFRIFGIEQQPPSYELARSLVHPQDVQFWEQSVQSSLSNGLFQIDYRAVRPDGTVVWIHNEAIIIKDDNGRPVKMIGTAQDVTAQKNNEIELKKRERQLRHCMKLHQLIAQVSSLFANSTAEDLDVSINRMLADIGLFIGADRSYLFQFSDDLTTSSNTHEWCAEDIKPEIENLQNIASAPLKWKMGKLRRGENIVIESVADSPQEAHTEKKLLESQDIRAVLIVPVNCGNKLSGFLGFDSVQKEKRWSEGDIRLLRTISEIVGNTIQRIQKEQALSQSENKFSKAFHDSPGFLLISDFETGESLEVNKAFCEMTGYSSMEVIGRTSIELGILTAEQRAEMTDELARKGKIKNQEYRIRAKNGDIRTCLFSAALIELRGRRCLVASGMDITDRKQAEAHLRDSEERFRLFMDNSPTIAWMKDDKGRYVYLNKGLEQRFFKRHKKWFGKTGGYLWPRKITEQFKKEDRAVVESGRPIKYAGEATNANGSRSYWLCWKFPFKDSSGKVYTAGIGLDISERRQAEEALRQSEELHRLALEAAQLGTWNYNPLTQEAGWDHRNGEIFGLHPDTPLNEAQFLSMVHPEDRNRVAGTIEDMMQPSNEGKHIQVDYRIIRADGDERWVNASGKAFFDHVGPERKAVCVIGTHMDITERKKYENALKESEEEKTFILESISDMVAYFDFDMKLKWANKAWLEAAGKNLDSVLGRHCYQTWHNKDKPCSGCPIDRSRKTLKPEESEIQHGDGPIWRIRGYPVFKKDGTPSAIIEFTRDVSIQKRSEEAMRTARDELDRKVRERTAELEHRNREIRELAHKTIQAMENDRRALAKELHDSIGGTLAAIMYQLESRIENVGPPPPSVAIPLEKIISYLSVTIQESRRITKQLRPSVLDDFGLLSAMQEHIRDFQQFYPKISIRQDISGEAENLSGDAKTVLYRVLQEALTNAGKHSSADGVEIRCRLQEGWITLEIKDNGAGFDAIGAFGNLQRMGGYGLHSMKERVEICKGKFKIESAPGKGTIVTASIPLQSD